MSTRPPRARAAIAVILMFGAGVTLRGISARAENCLSAPNSTAPPGKRWYYKVDHATQQKCWYTHEPGHAAAKRPMPSSHSTPSPSGPNRAAEAASTPVIPGEATAPPPPSESPSAKPAAPLSIAAPPVPETSSPTATTGPGRSAQLAAGQTRKRLASSSRSRPSPSELNRAGEASPVPVSPGNAAAPPSEFPAVKPSPALVGSAAPSVPETPSPPASAGPGQLAQQAAGQTKKRPAPSSHSTQSPSGPNRAGEAAPMPASRGEATSPTAPSESPSGEAAAPVSIAAPSVPETLSPPASTRPGRSVQQTAGLANKRPAPSSHSTPSPSRADPAGEAAPVPARTGEPTGPQAPSEFPPVPVSGAAPPIVSAPASTWLETSAEANAPAENSPLLPSGSNDKSVQQAAHEQNASSNPDTPAPEASTSAVTATQATAPPAVAWDPLVKPLDPPAVRIEAPAAMVTEDAERTAKSSDPTNAGMPITASSVVALVLALVLVVILFRDLIKLNAARRVAIFADDAELNRDDDLEFYRKLREVGARDNPFNQPIK